MAQTRIEQIVEEIYAYIEGCKLSPLSQSKVIVQKDELYEMLDELRLRTPDEVKRCQKIIGQREAIIAKANSDAGDIIKEAEEKAAQIEADAMEHAQQLVEENEIMQKAFAQANTMIQGAKDQAEKIMADADNYSKQVRDGALGYTNDVLTTVGKVLSDAYREAKDNSDRLINSLRDNLATLQQNQEELQEAIDNPDGIPEEEPVKESFSPAPSYSEPADEAAAAEDAADDDFDFPEGTFLNEDM